MQYRDKHVLVLGLGESGLAMARWLTHTHARLRVADTRIAPERLTILQTEMPTAKFIGGQFTPALLDDIDFIAVSPGLNPHNELAELLPIAAEKNIPVWGEIELFAQALAALKEEREYQPKVIAITGTNGKTTVTSLTGLLCKQAGLSVQVAGNISPAALDVLLDAVNKDALPDCWVLELSSFQLHTTFSLQADAATVLNITQDHLDWHGDMQSYAKDKQRIFGEHTVRVLNRQDALCMKMEEATTADCVTFGTDLPDTPDALGLVTEHGMQWLLLAVGSDESEKTEKRRRKNTKQEVELYMNKLMPSDALKIRGQHNATNALAAIALCRAIGLPLAPLLHAARQYQGEPHRVELVARIRDVDYVDDSKGTNVGATVAALKGLGRDTNPNLILIAGGDGKGQDFSPLAAPVAAHVRTVILIGRDAPAIRQALAQSAVTIKDCTSLFEAVMHAASIANQGDTVLLSPACASFDMFANYAERAKVFIDGVREIGLSQGEVMA
jgi:UDP-N-acetylmuramoylalanine--D-glutamate ligase